MTVLKKVFLFVGLAVIHLWLEYQYLWYLIFCSDGGKCAPQNKFISGFFDFPLGYLLELLPKPSDGFSTILPAWTLDITLPLNSIAFVGFVWWLVYTVRRLGSQRRSV